jgi:hypothetical protein
MSAIAVIESLSVMVIRVKGDPDGALPVMPVDNGAHGDAPSVNHGPVSDWQGAVTVFTCPFGDEFHEVRIALSVSVHRRLRRHEDKKTPGPFPIRAFSYLS